MITCVRRIQFCAGHRVYKHEGKCAQPHGHNYVAHFEADAPELDSVGRIVDFGVLKERIGGWIEKWWDHGFILFQEDVVLVNLFGNMAWKHHVINVNPTAENMADFLLRYVCPTVLEGTNVTVRKVELWETENCYAIAEREQ